MEIMNDIVAKAGVEIVIRHDGLVIWINCDGICTQRIITNGFVPITVQDDRNNVRIKMNEV